ncbi:right-handed parallel beta-helix repeat-containing protein [Qaidamihabitans albus]|uniref:right-handed parallel beta-helix repeat-containing protein n=1 Tax=Qaidamihabitans albus TaxID=2795733 RepID=UPI0018F1811B|nr:right-handed parallel beta-helix repeat-containing protein [Qaidamihabitans albus]
MTEFHVSPAGDDSAPGTPERPFGTLHRAQRAAREASGEVVVHLRTGTHVLAGPLELTEDDSGRDGHRITYQAYGYGTGDQEQAVVSGGRVITGWQERDGRWLAEVGDLETRQLYVDGRRAERAGIDGLPGTASRTGTGYVTDSSAPLDWQDPAGVEFVYRGIYPWTEARCGVAAVARDGDSATVTMSQPAFSRAVDLYNSAWEGHVLVGPDLPTRVENDLAFLTEPGTFALDRSRPGRHVLHYLPRPGEHLARTQVVAPALETLLRATGTRDVSFRGLTFADATWLRPSSDRGFLHYHGNAYYDGGGIDRVVVVEGEAWVTVPTESETIPACVSLDGTTATRFEGCRFTRLGATGLGATGGADLTVRGCDFDTLAASAASVTGSGNALIEDNLIRRIGLDYSGSPGIALMNTVDCAVVGNHVSDVPHCGIIAGPGKGTRILRNLTTATMGVLADGGGIYVGGPQGDSQENGAVVSGNVIRDTRTPYNFALYTDYGASWVTVEGNVVARADNTAVLQVSPPLEHVVYRGNFWDADPLGSDAVPAGVTYEDNVTLADEGELDAATAAIQARAGLRRVRVR